jgi:uncharacterized membrane protein
MYPRNAASPERIAIGTGFGFAIIPIIIKIILLFVYGFNSSGGYNTSSNKSLNSSIISKQPSSPRVNIQPINSTFNTHQQINIKK